MESWNYVCEEGKGFVSDESTSDKNVLMGWELGFSEMERKPWIAEEHESSSKFSSSGSVVESSDLKLPGGGLPPSKKVKAGVNSLIPYCQVYGCRKDLTSFKDYYRRHKVCEVHSKTVKVIVNDIEQRFCQQCSRFHLLGEFDDGKRSCRKRLAGHNERRRKPLPGRNGRQLQSYNGSKIQWNSLSLSSPPFIFQDVASSCFTHELKDNPSNWIKHRKIEDGSGHDPQPEISPHLFGKDCQAYPMTAKYLYEHDQGTVNSGSGLVFQNISTVSEDFCRDYSTPSVQGLSTSSGQARSLLSSQSPRIPFVQPTDVMSCGKIYSVGTNSIEGNQLITDDHVDFTEGFLPESEMMNAKEHVSCDDGRFTMDLLQLSSQLQRVEQQRQSPQVKQEIGTFYGLRMT